MTIIIARMDDSNSLAIELGPNPKRHELDDKSPGPRKPVVMREQIPSKSKKSRRKTEVLRFRRFPGAL
eukprot:CAMPEP_0170198526 /NCGR_PEP_ID=MMETSP0040_2-20121228/68823_1 /TAXON_ID=641309 /ORGANISM="Lotharella oceanica, Strain CCMP622" /LENGTH=67 /DNA_ID=CAMNT_0010448529 /DNA_START=771 /DNA_END=974 /DNA_ORIENTATION=-